MAATPSPGRRHRALTCPGACCTSRQVYVPPAGGWPAVPEPAKNSTPERRSHRHLPGNESSPEACSSSSNHNSNLEALGCALPPSGLPSRPWLPVQRTFRKCAWRPWLVRARSTERTVQGSQLLLANWYAEYAPTAGCKCPHPSLLAEKGLRAFVHWACVQDYPGLHNDSVAVSY